MMEEAITYLRELAERIMRIPATYGVDQSDTDRLLEIANAMADEFDTKQGYM
jgi:hypothetical protein